MFKKIQLSNKICYPPTPVKKEYFIYLSIYLSRERELHQYQEQYLYGPLVTDFSDHEAILKHNNELTSDFYFCISE